MFLGMTSGPSLAINLSLRLIRDQGMFWIMFLGYIDLKQLEPNADKDSFHEFQMRSLCCTWVGKGPISGYI